MRVLVGYPPIPSSKGVPLLSQNRQFQWFSRPTYIFPVVPATAATMLKKAGHDVLFLDGIASGMTPAEFAAKMADFAPDVFAMETKTPVVKKHWEMIRGFKEAMPSLKIVLAGDHVTAMPEETMAQCPVDYILTGGDWDFLLRNLVESNLEPSHFEPGIWYRDGAEVRNTGAFRLDHDLNEAPWIDRELVSWRLYAEKNGNFRKTPGTYIMSARDCWHAKCTFCSWTTLYPKYRVRNPENVLDEIEHLVRDCGVKEIMDDSGSFPAGEWLKTFCNGMIKRGLNKKVRIDCNMRFGRLGADDYKLMRKAGFRFVLFGMESANQETLDRLVKALDANDIEKGARMASKAGLDVHITVMFGYPWEGRAEIEKTVALARKLIRKNYAYTLQCTITIPYPGTPLFKELAASGGLATLDWDEYDMRRQIMKTPLVSEDEIKCAVRRVYSAVFHPEALARRLFSTRLFTDFGFYVKGLMLLTGHLFDFKSSKQNNTCGTGRRQGD